MTSKKALIYVLLSVILTSCAHKVQIVNQEIFREAGLSFLKDGETTKAEVLSNLGTAQAQFEGGSILAYRLDDTYQVVIRTYASGGCLEWGRANYSLVLVFDEDEVMQRHSLVRVR